MSARGTQRGDGAAGRRASQPMLATTSAAPVGQRVSGRIHAVTLAPPLGAPDGAAPKRRAPMTPGVSRASRVRAYVAGTLLTFGLFGVGYKAWGLQVDGAEHWRAEAERQHVMMVNIAAPRGEIIDARARPLAVTADADSVWANPREITDVAGTAEQLATLLGVDVAGLEAKLAADKHFAWLARHVTPELAAAARAAKLPGVYVTREPRRWYPGGGIGGPIVGRANIDGEGLDGVELAMNDLLTGRRARSAALRDSQGHAAMADGLIDAEPGATVQLTIDRTIQAMVDEELARAVTAHGARSGTVVVLDVATSQVLAMSSVPSYDPNDEPTALAGKRKGSKAAEGPRNRAVTDAFEIGSSMKLFTVAAALDAGVTRADEWWDVEGGSYRVVGKPSPVRDVHHDQALTTGGIIKRSSNVGAVKIAQRLGREKLDQALRRYGFGERTGIELPGEVGGRIRPTSEWREVGLATIAYGYGMTVTPMQLAAAVATIGNGGVYQAPRIVSQVTKASGEVIYAPAPERRQAMKPRTAAAMLPMLASVFDKGKDGGTAGSIVVPGFTCGAKTGTAHKFDPALGGYAPDKYYSSMVGLAPIAAPRIAVVVLIDEPSEGDYFGGKVAGPVFAAITSAALRYLGVPGEKIVAKADGKADPKTAPAPVADPEPASAPSPEVEAPLDVAAGGMPDLRGLGLRAALDRLRELGLTARLEGTGVVVAQEPAAGALRPADEVALTLSDRAMGRP
jgi:cell division protein FtsI (penicillin-binding protein 3)